jgi:quercetin dioxygenase-like cupin family protein
MQIVRVFSGDDNESHFEELTADQLTELITSRVGDGPITVNRGEAQSFSDFHNAPRLQYVVMMAGEIEFETGDGTKRRMGPGDVLVAEDLTGHGHISRGVGTGPRMSLAVPLAPAFLT